MKSNLNRTISSSSLPDLSQSTSDADPPPHQLRHKEAFVNLKTGEKKAKGQETPPIHQENYGKAIQQGLIEQLKKTENKELPLQTPSGSGNAAANSSNPKTLGARKRPNFKIDISPDTIISASGIKLSRTKIDKETAGSQLFHGSRSSSLLAFTSPDDQIKGHLLPMGEMLKRGIYPFSGEAGYALHEKAFNKDHISTVRKQNFEIGFNYSSHVNAGKWSPETERERMSDVSNVQDGDGIQEFLKAKNKFSEGRLSQWNNMSEAEKKLVSDNFPVLYGIDINPFGEKVDSNEADFGFEFGVKGSVLPKDIKLIFTSDDHVEQVKQALSACAEASHIQVKPFSLIQG